MLSARAKEVPLTLSRGEAPHQQHAVLQTAKWGNPLVVPSGPQFLLVLAKREISGPGVPNERQDARSSPSVSELFCVKPRNLKERRPSWQPGPQIARAAVVAADQETLVAEEPRWCKHARRGVVRCCGDAGESCSALAKAPTGALLTLTRSPACTLAESLRRRRAAQQSSLCEQPGVGCLTPKHVVWPGTRRDRCLQAASTASLQVQCPLAPSLAELTSTRAASSLPATRGRFLP